MRLPAIVTLILALCHLAQGTLAAPRGIQPGAEAERWAAVGILQVSGGGFCSAALLDQKTVLTAAHCVYPNDSRNIARPSQVTFNAGWRDGITAAKRTAVRIVAHRGYDPAQPYDVPNISADLAIVELDEPVPADAARAFGKMDKVRPGAAVSIVSFSGRRSDVASINEGCTVEDQQGNILILDCSSFPGMSGAPVFSFQNGIPRIVALISGSQTDPTTGQNRAIALAVDAPLGRVSIDARAVRSTPTDALPYWTAREAPPGLPVATAERKIVKAGSRSGAFKSSGSLSSLTGSGTARTVVRPPSSAN